MDWGKRRGILFIDLNKDFDAVNHLLLLHKVSNGRVFYLMKSLLQLLCLRGSYIFITCVNNYPKCCGIEMCVYMQTIHHRMFKINILIFLNKGCIKFSIFYEMEGKNKR